ncbi:YlcI/YnfO family protein [Luteimonas salinilitoris]|uniref:YlcI/YnfO family protein n=1 Tax=Luteimonas salinilitoris TaxID=3237697 RepID=A0ABV4HKC0_9GAMM
MKTATFPPLRVEPALRRAAEDVLHEGETLSAFVEASVRAQIDLRRTQVEFVARGLAARERARREGSYVAAGSVLESLEERLKKARQSRR